MRERIMMEKENLPCEIKLLTFRKKCLEKMWKSCCRKFFEQFFNQFSVRTTERSTDEEETKITTTASPNQTNKFTSKLESWFQLDFSKCILKTQKFVKTKRFRTVLKV